MKCIHRYTWLIAGMLFLVSCAKDNYDAPNSYFTGSITYNGEPIHVEWNQVRFQLWENGYTPVTPIDVTIAQDGTFSALLFNNTYKLSFPGGQGPFKTKDSGGSTKDTILVNINGDQQMDIEVVPYYMVRDPQIVKSGSNVDATIRLEKIINGADAKDIERVTLYLNKTQFVSGANNIATSSINGPDITDFNSIGLSLAVPAMTPAQDFIYARVGVKISGVEDLIFSPVQKLSL